MRGASRCGSARRCRWARCRATWSPTGVRRHPRWDGLLIRSTSVRSVSRRGGDRLLRHHLAVAPDFLLVVLPVEDVPLVPPFLARPLLRPHLPPHHPAHPLAPLHLSAHHL